MKNYLELVPQYERVHRKNNRISVFCIILSVLLVTAIFSMADMALRAQKNYFIRTNGEYHISLTGIDDETAALLGARIDVALCGWVLQGSTGAIGPKAVSFAGADEDAFTTLTEMNLQSGSYPSKENEVLLNETALHSLGLSVGECISVTIPDGTRKEFLITGVLEDMASLLKADVCGVVLSEDGFRAIADENAKDGSTFRVLFKDGVPVQKAVREIQSAYGLTDSQTAENTALLGLLGQSENSTMQSLYLVAAFLVLLVLAAGTVMIAASFNTNVLERIQFYGLLRCLGASRKQVKQFVLLQGIRQSIRGVPAGLAAGQLVSWGACLLLRSVSSRRFSEIPLFQFSAAGLIAGTVIGFLIVLLASLSPARKASKASPITAVSGNTAFTDRQPGKTRHPRFPKCSADTKIFHVETAMGIFHALSGKKNLFLMTCSFAISIMLFLSFQVMVVFLNQGMPALSPSAPDVTVSMGAARLDQSLIQQINALDGVDKAYGRMEKTDLAFTCNGKDGTVTLISYDSNQFLWAGDALCKGRIPSPQEKDDYVLVTYSDEMNWNIGDTVTLSAPSGNKPAEIAGILTSVNAQSSGGSNGYIICSEETFMDIAGYSGYTTIDLQLLDTADDSTLSAIRSLSPKGSSVSDKRLANSESQSSYYTGAVFIYGFLIIIALITVFQIFNNMNASVASRTKQYGIMRSIGMGANQLYKMIAAEAAAYAVLGCIAGCVLGLPLNKMMFQFLITDKWGISWRLPVSSLALIVLLCFLSAAVAVRRPIKQMKGMAIVDTIKQ